MREWTYKAFVDCLPAKERPAMGESVVACSKDIQSFWVACLHHFTILIICTAGQGLKSPSLLAAWIKVKGLY